MCPPSRPATLIGMTNDMQRTDTTKTTDTRAADPGTADKTGTAATRAAATGAPATRAAAPTKATDTIRPTKRRTGRALTIAASTAGALLLWAVNAPWAGTDLAVRQGTTIRPIGPPAIALTALIAGIAAWALLALLERTVRRPAQTFRIIALTVLAFSLAGPLTSGVDTNSRLALLGMHTTVGAALILGLPSRRTCR
jgi:hypothetical protein